MFSAKKRLLAFSVATAVGMTAGNVGAYERAPNGIGMYNLLPYYTVQEGFSTVLHITNTDTVQGKAVKVRFRGAEWSDDVFDFTLFLSPGDIWTGAVTRNGDLATMSTDDVSCTLPESVEQDFITFRLFASEDENAGTREGYVEIITMADIPPVDFDRDDSQTYLYKAIKHVNGVAPCNGVLGTTTAGDDIVDVLSNLSEDQGTARTLFQDEDPDPYTFNGVLNPGNAGQGMTTPTGSLMSYSINIDVPTSKAFTTPAVAVNPLGLFDSAQRKIFFRQANEALDWDRDGDFGLTADLIFADDQLLNADPALGGLDLQMFQFDMPDLTTPIFIDETLFDLDELDFLDDFLTEIGYAGEDLTALIHRNLFTRTLRRSNALVEYSTDDGLDATTDVVFNQPTRRFYYWYDYSCEANDSCSYPIDDPVIDILGEGDYDPTEVDTIYYGQNLLYSSLDGDANTINVGFPDFWDREEDNFDEPTDIVISPTPPAEQVAFKLKGEASVVSINDGALPTGSLEASLTAFNYDAPLAGEDGWVVLDTTGDDGPLPVIGFTAIKVFNGAIGTAGTNYGFTLPLRTPVSGFGSCCIEPEPEPFL
jgi:hypothetical protein